MWIWTANKFAKFHTKRLNRSENIPKSVRGLLFSETPCIPRTQTMMFLNTTRPSWRAVGGQTLLFSVTANFSLYHWVCWGRSPCHKRSSDITATFCFENQCKIAHSGSYQVISIVTSDNIVSKIDPKITSKLVCPSNTRNYQDRAPVCCPVELAPMCTVWSTLQLAPYHCQHVCIFTNGALHRRFIFLPPSSYRWRWLMFSLWHRCLVPILVFFCFARMRLLNGCQWNLRTIYHYQQLITFWSKLYEEQESRIRQKIPIDIKNQ